ERSSPGRRQAQSKRAVRDVRPRQGPPAQGPQRAHHDRQRRAVDPGPIAPHLHLPGSQPQLTIMRYSFSLPTERIDPAAEFVTQSAVAEIARAAEDAGFHACYVTDHPFPPHRWLYGGGHHALDPFVALSFAAAATSTLRLQTHIMVLPYRNPFLTAKSVLSLDVLSRGRVILRLAP